MGVRRVQGLRVKSLGLRGLGLRGSGFRILDLGCMVQVNGLNKSFKAHCVRVCYKERYGSD